MQNVQCYNRRVAVTVAEILFTGALHTQRWGERLGRLLKPGDVLCLSGELGAGKTTLAAGIGRGWGSLQTVNSPTFVFINEYTRAEGSRLFHIDAYRLRNAADSESIGLSDVLDSDGVVLIEWADRIAPHLPADRLWIDLTWLDADRRQAQVRADGARYELLLAQLGDDNDSRY